MILTNLITVLQTGFELIMCLLTGNCGQIQNSHTPELRTESMTPPAQGRCSQIRILYAPSPLPVSLESITSCVYTHMLAHTSLSSEEYTDVNNK